MKRILPIIIFFLSLLQSKAQEMPITTGSITQCGGFLVDDGLSSSNYSSNLNATTTVCAQSPETIVNLYFAVCALGSGDYLEIFDGPNTSAPLIGTYYADDLQSTDITSTNASGCLTVHFVSDNDGVVGNFGAEISCGPPCERPFAIVNSNEGPAPIKICPGETVNFDASATTFASGASFASANWIFDDGTTSSAWPTVSHTFTEPGGYVVQLEVTDNNDCHSVNLPDYVVLVSTYPDFSLLSPAFDLCAGGTDWMGVNLVIPDSLFATDSLNSWISQPWVDLPDINLGGALFIPDDQSECFSDEVTFSNFDYNQTINSITDINNFYINFEHSFMGDITITYICPNGNSLIVHQQGGGGTLLGEPVDDDADLSPGIGYDYYWSPTATNGTWADNGSGTLPAGTYESVQPWTNLIGCPLNGTWEIQVCDMWASDNGYIFDWGISFNPELYGDLIHFEPIYGPNCDSTYWVGPNIINQTDGCDFIEIELNETGTYNYTYYATNDFGCTFDTTITVNVFVAPSVNAGPDLVFNCNPLSMTGTLEGDVMDFVWQWSPTIGLSDAASASPTVTVTQPMTYTLTGYPVGYPGCATSDQMQVTLDPGLGTPGADTDISICPTAAPINMFDLLNGNPDPGGYWLDTSGSITDEIFDPLTEPAGNYYYNIASGDCVLSTRFGITVELPSVVAANDTIICINGTAELRASSPTDFAGNYIYHWSTNQIGQSVNTSPSSTQYFSVFVEDVNGCVSETDSMLVDFYAPLSVMTNGNDTICQGGGTTLDISAASGGYGGYHYQWTFNGQIIGTGTPMDHTPTTNGEYCVSLTDGCETPEATNCHDLLIEEPVVVTITSDTTSGCSPLAIHLSITNDATTYAASSLTFSDSFSFNSDSVEHVLNDPGVYDVTARITSNAGCYYENTYDDYLHVFAKPTAAWAATPQPTDVMSPEISFVNQSSEGAISSFWTFNVPSPFGFSVQENPVFTFPNDSAGHYSVSLKVTDVNHCVDVEIHDVVINDILNVYVPNTFTPNNDGVNDVLLVHGTDIRKDQFEFTIFNRWGDVVFKTTDPAMAWVGNYNNGDHYVGDGLYNYILKVAAGSTSEKKEYKGTILLLR